MRSEPERILYLSLLPDLYRGGQVSLLHLMTHLPRDRFRPILAVPGEGGFAAAARHADIETHIQPAWPRLLRQPLQTARSLASLRKLIASTDPDLIHVDVPRLAHLAAPLKGSRPLVSHLRVVDRDGLSDRLLAFESDAMIAISGAVAARFRFYPGNVRRKLHVIHNPVDTERFRPRSAEERSSLRTRFGLPQDRPIAVLLAGFIPLKRHGFALEVWADVVRELDALLVFSGPGEEGDIAEVRSRIDELGLKEKVRLLPPTDAPEELLGACDLCILPSREEGFGRVVVEAGACGLPAVASDLPGLREAIDDGGSGFLVDREDKTGWVERIVALLRDPEHRAAIGEAARQRATDLFSIQHHVEAVTSLYDRLLQNRP